MKFLAECENCAARIVVTSTADMQVFSVCEECETETCPSCDIRGRHLNCIKPAEDAEPS